MKTLSYSDVKYTPRVPLSLLTVKKIKSENLDYVVLLLLSQFLVLSLRHKYMQKRIGHIYVQMIYTPNDCCTIRDFPFLVRAAATELRSVNYGSQHTSQFFHVCHCVRTYIYNLKTKGHVRMLFLSNDCSTIKDTVFTAVCKIHV